MITVELLDSIDQAMTSPWGVTKEVRGRDFSARLEFSPYNRRILILDCHFSGQEGSDALITLLEDICVRRNLGKIWGKIRQHDKDCFISRGFRTEAKIPGFFASGQDAVICSRFFDERGSSQSQEANQKVFNLLCASRPVKPTHVSLPKGYHFVLAGKKDLPALAALYRQVFATYPYPVYDVSFLEKCMQHTVYGLVYQDNDLVAAASAEINYQLANAEMTDFASLPLHRGQGLASFILTKLEETITARGIRCLYTLARSTSAGMNLTFSRASYSYAGTLVNNCNISGGFEDMNVFYKNC